MFKKFVKGLLFGAVAGTAGGLLLAPRRGSETRDKIKSELTEMTELTLEVNDSLQHLKTALITTKTTAQTLLPEFQTGLKKDLQNFQFQAQPRLDQINEQIDILNEHLESSQQGLQRFYLKRPDGLSK